MSMPKNIRDALAEQHDTETQDHPDGNRARPDNNWPPKGGEAETPKEKVASNPKPWRKPKGENQEGLNDG